MNDVYSQLARHLDTLPVPFPETGTGIELEILKKWFSPRHAEIALKMTGVPEAVPDIAKRMEVSPETLAPVLEEMSRKGLIFRTTQRDSRKSGDAKCLYNLVPVAEGIWEFHVHAMGDQEVSQVNEYVEFFMKNAWYKTRTTQHRIIPISKSISAEMEIMQYDQAEKIIKSQTKIAVTHCVCRKQAKMLGKGCDHPSEVCLAFGTGAYFFIENGWGREISQEEALGVLQAGIEAGLVIQPGNGQKTWSICMCCSCSCQLLRTLKKMERPALMAHTNFYAACIEEKCTSCGVCVDRCPMEAISLEGTAIVNNDRCIGCGVCVAACNFDAMVLHQKHENDRYSPPRDMIEMQKRISEERGLS